MGGYYYGIDYTYLIFVLPAIILSIIAQIKVKSAYGRYSKEAVMSGMTGAQAAEAVLRAGGVTDVSIECIDGNLTDNYNPADNTIRLSRGVYENDTVAAVGVAAHEAGHALQCAEGYGPFKLRNAIVGITRIGSTLAWPLVFIGLIFNFEALFLVGIIFFGAVCVFQIVTLPVEFNASSRAVMALEATGALTADELPGAKKVLSAAAMTYVAAMLVSLGQMLRLLMLFNRRR